MSLTAALLDPIADTCPVEDDPINPLTEAALHGITRALASVGRAFVCLDPDFRIVHASHLLDQLLTPGASAHLRGQPVEALFDKDSFGPGSPLRQALEQRQRREGWRATLRFGETAQRLVSITAAPMLEDGSSICDPRVAFLILMRPAEEEAACSDSPSPCSGAIACSPPMQRIFRLVETLQSSEASILITGESGSGKEVVARAIHQHSVRSAGPFVAVNCAALPSELLESELFGHIRGAFTGAVRDRTGRFELASGGTLFLDEIGDLPPLLQVKLLRVLQERRFERVGESIPRITNARIIAATNVDIRAALRDGRLREDLYYRLCVVPIDVPPLRHRREDIPQLALNLLNRVAGQRGLVRRISPHAMRVLLDYNWPGNVRELSNAMEYAVAVSKMETILPEDLPEELRLAALHHQALAEAHHEPAPEPHRTHAHHASTLSEQERLRAALDSHHWKKAETAKALGLSRSTLWRRMRELKLA
ncbi:MAG: sigma-54 dependent transcriptional regulator [Terracidiphilus sp.]